MNKDAVMASMFVVTLVSVIDSYRLVERSIKYGILLIAPLFTAFFLVGFRSEAVQRGIR